MSLRSFCFISVIVYNSCFTFRTSQVKDICFFLVYFGCKCYSCSFLRIFYGFRKYFHDDDFVVILMSRIYSYFIPYSM